MEEEALEEEDLDEEGHDVVVLELGDLEESGLGEDPEEEDLGADPGGEGLEVKHLEEAGLVEGDHGHEEGTALSYCVEAAAQSRL